MSSVRLCVPLNTTYLFPHDSWLPDQTNESQKSLEETFVKATERRKPREYRGVLSFKGNFPSASFLWAPLPRVPCLVPGNPAGLEPPLRELPLSRRCPDFPRSTRWFSFRSQAVGPLPASLGAPHSLPAPESGWETAPFGERWGGGRPLCRAGQRPVCEKSVPIFRGSGAVSEREKQTRWPG